MRGVWWDVGRWVEVPREHCGWRKELEGKVPGPVICDDGSLLHKNKHVGSEQMRGV